MNYTSYRIIGIDITRFWKKVHFGKKLTNKMRGFTHVTIMKCRSSSLNSPQLWSWYPYQRSALAASSCLIFSNNADPSLWQIMLHSNLSIDEHVLLKIFLGHALQVIGCPNLNRKLTRLNSQNDFAKLVQINFPESEIKGRFRGCLIVFVQLSSCPTMI